MSWYAVNRLHFIGRIMDHFVYLDILKNNLRDTVNNMEILDKYVFQQDNDPKHKVRIVSEWLLYNTPKILEKPPVTRYKHY